MILATGPLMYQTGAMEIVMSKSCRPAHLVVVSTPKPYSSIMNVQEFYEQTIKSLPSAQRLRLEALILNDIAPPSVVDDSDSWTEEALQDFAQVSWQQMEERLEGEENA